MRNTPEVVKPLLLIPDRSEGEEEGNEPNAIPSWLEGSLYFIGPGIFELELGNGQPFHFSHSFDGLAQLHRIQFIQNDKAITPYYTSRCVAKGVQNRLAAHDDTVLFFGQKVSQSPVDRIRAIWRQSFTQTPLSYYDVDPFIIGQLCPSHAHYDPVTNEYLNFTVNIAFPYIQYTAFSLDQVGNASYFEPVTQNLARPGPLSLRPCFIHAFMVTTNFLIIPNWPYVYKCAGLSIIWNGTVSDSLRWDPTLPTLFHILDRKSRRHIATYELPACFALHTINAWEEVSEDRSDVTIAFDIPVYPDPTIVMATADLGKVERENQTLNVQPPQVWRVRLAKVRAVQAYQSSLVNLGYVNALANSIARITLGPSWSPSVPFTSNQANYHVLGTDLELPRFNPYFRMRRYRYVYGIRESTKGRRYSEGGAIMSGLLKMDLDQVGRIWVWDETGCNCSEPVFIPRLNQDATELAEDDGVVLSLVNVHGHVEASNRAFLLILDAQTFQEVARIPIASYNITTIHGTFVDRFGHGISVP